MEDSFGGNSQRRISQADEDERLSLAKEIRVPALRVNDIVLQKRGITADTAVRLARFFGTSEQFWLGLQSAYEVSVVKSERRDEIDQIKPLQYAH